MSKPRRPPGSVGRKVTAYSNAFELTWTQKPGTTGFVYHYDGKSSQFDDLNSVFIVVSVG